MKIKLKKQFLTNKSGEIINVESNIAKALIDKGDAVFATIDDLSKVSVPKFHIRGLR